VFLSDLKAARQTEKLGRLFLMALNSGSIGATRACLASGHNVNGVDAAGRTPLMIAAIKGNRDLLVLLLEAGADTTQTDAQGLNVFEYAARTSNNCEAMLAESRAGCASYSGSEADPDLNLDLDLDLDLDPDPDPDPDPEPEPEHPEESSADGLLPKFAAPALRPALESSEPADDIRDSEIPAVSRTRDLPDKPEDWIEDSGPTKPAGDEQIRVQAGQLDQFLSRSAVLSSDEDWDEVEISLPTPAASQRPPVLAPAARREARKIFAYARSTGSLLLPDLRTEKSDLNKHAVSVLVRVAEDAGIKLCGDPDPWLRCLEPETVQPSGSFVRELIERLETAESRPAFYNQIRSMGTFDREQEQSIWHAIDQTLGEVGLEIARSRQAVSFVLAANSRVETGELGVSFISSLAQQTHTGEAANPDELEFEAEEEMDDRQNILLRIEYETAIGHLKQLQIEYKSGATPSGASISSCARSLKDCALSADFLVWICGELICCEPGSGTAALISAALIRMGKLRDRMVTMHLGRVARFARKFQGSGLDYDDLVQEGAIGLLRAVELFEPGRGHKFWTYASFWMGQTMARALDEKAWAIRLPAGVRAKARHFQAVVKKQLSSGAEVLETWEMAERLGCSESLVRLFEKGGEDQFRTEAISTHIALMLERGSTQLLDEPTPFASASQAELCRMLDEALKELDPRAERVLRLRFGLGNGQDHTLEEVGEQYGVTRERIRQIEAKSLRRLAHPAISKKLRSCLN
jgi:RNA polymerase primary sigma factor